MDGRGDITYNDDFEGGDGAYSDEDEEVGQQVVLQEDVRGDTTCQPVPRLGPPFPPRARGTCPATLVFAHAAAGSGVACDFLQPPTQLNWAVLEPGLPS